MDETGQPGGIVPGENGKYAGPRKDSARLNGSSWASDPWSNAGDALEPAGEPVLPTWRQPSDFAANLTWAPGPTRVSDLPPTGRGGRYDPITPGANPPGGEPPASAPPYPYEGDLEDAARYAAEPEPVIPTERPPPPVERDRSGDVARHAALSGGTPISGVPTVNRHSWRDTLAPPERPQAPPGQASAPPARPGFAQFPPPSPPPSPRPTRSALNPLAPAPEPTLPPPAPYESPRGYDTSTSPGYRSSGYGPAEALAEPGAPRAGFDTGRVGVPAAPSGYDYVATGQTGAASPMADVLPQRVPAEPDVPTVPEPPAAEPPAETPELKRIASHLRRDDVPTELRDRPEGFDVNAVLAAVRGVAGVRDASLRSTPAGAHSLRLDLSDGADPALVSREVARLLQEKLGLAASPQDGTRDEPTWPGRSATDPGPWADPPRANPQPADVPRPGRRRAQTRARAGLDTPAGSLYGTPSGVAGASRLTDSDGGRRYLVDEVASEAAPSRPLHTGGRRGPRVVIDHVQVSTFGLDATVEVRLAADAERSVGFASGPSVDSYVLRMCAVAASAAVDELLASAERRTDRGRCFVEHAAVVPFGGCDVAVVVLLLVCGGWVEQLSGSALVSGDARQAVVRATLAAVNRRLEALL